MENNTEEPQLKKYKKSFITPITPFNSTEKHLNKGNENYISI